MPLLWLVRLLSPRPSCLPLTLQLIVAVRMRHDDHNAGGTCCNCAAHVSCVTAISTRVALVLPARIRMNKTYRIGVYSACRCASNLRDGEVKDKRCRDEKQRSPFVAYLIKQCMFKLGKDGKSEGMCWNTFWSGFARIKIGILHISERSDGSVTWNYLYLSW